jgi:hypothetical protein
MSVSVSWILGIILKVPGFEIALPRANVLIDILFKWYTLGQNARNFCLFVFVNKIVCLHSHSNTEPLNQNISEQQVTILRTEIAASLALAASPVQHVQLLTRRVESYLLTDLL